MADSPGPRIFISYRRGDSPGHALLVKNGLEQHFGPGHVFMDIDTIQPGEDFADAISEAVGSCDVLLAMIGRAWATATDADGKRRLEDPDDFVRMEIGAALERNVKVVPVLVEGAPMPGPKDLPGELSRLARLQAFEMSDARWSYDLSRLLRVLDKEAVVQESTATGAASQVGSRAVPSAPTVAVPATAGAAPTAASRTSLVGAFRVPAAWGIQLLGGAAIVIGSVLPWITSSYQKYGSSEPLRSTVRIGLSVHNNLGMITAVAGLVLVAIAILTARSSERLSWAPWASAGCALIAFAVAARKFAVTQSTIDYERGFVRLEPMAGLFLVLGAATAALLAALWVLLAAVRSRGVPGAAKVAPQ